MRICIFLFPVKKKEVCYNKEILNQTKMDAIVDWSNLFRN